MNSIIILCVIVTPLFFLQSLRAVRIRGIQNARLVTNDTAMTTSTNSSVVECLCQALGDSAETVAVNYYSDSATCEFFTSYEPFFEVRIHLLSTLYLIQSLPTNPCCTNLTWLGDKIGDATEQYEVSVNMPQNLVIDNYDRLVTVEYMGRLIQMNRYNLSIQNRFTLNSTVVVSVSYNNGLYYIGTGVYGVPDNINALLIYNTTDMNLLLTITGDPSYFGPIRECQFLRNNTQMLVISQVSFSYSLILLYQINSPTNYTLLRSDIQTPTWAGFSIYKVNDTFFYVTLYDPNKPIHTLTSSSDGQNWTFGTFVTQGPVRYITSSVSVDACGRVWAADQASCIYIYDPNSGALLGTFTEVSNPYYILLHNDYELFVGTSKSQNKTYRFVPRLTCDS